MKKYLSILLCLVLVFQFTTVSWAYTIDSTETVTSMRIVIPLSEDEEDVAIMQKSGLEKFGLEKRESTYALGDNTGTFDLSRTNNLTLNFTKKTPTKDGLIVSGTAEIKVGGETISRPFTDVTFKLMDLGNNKAVYEGVVDITTVEKDIEIPAYIDIVAKTDFSEIVANVSLGTLESDAGLLAFGNLYEEYELYYDLISTSTAESDEDDTSSNMKGINDSSDEPTIEADDSYLYCGTGINSKVDGVTASGETVIIVAAKRDMAMRDSDLGFELGRVFSRSTNARNAVDGATRAYPHAVHVEFECQRGNFLDVEQAYPVAASSTGSGLAEFIGLAATLFDFTAGDFLAIAVGEIMDAVADISWDRGATIGGYYNWGEIMLNIDSTEYSNVDLPSSTSYSNAKDNTSNGVVVKFKYESAGTDSVSSANIILSGNIAYKIYAGTHRIYTVSTGSAEVEHVIENRDF